MSLRDQLLNSGLASKKQHQSALSSKKNKAKTKKSKKSKLAVDEKKVALNSVLEEKKARDRELNAGNEAKRQQQVLKAQIKDIITRGAVKKESGDVAYFFKIENKVKKWYISKDQRDKLAKGALAIVFFESNSYIIKADAAKHIEQKAPDVVLVWHKQKAVSEIEREEQAYADYKIPDDLDW